MSKEQIEEMARIICRDYNGGICATDGFVCNYNCEWTQIAKQLYNAGYRKQSEVAIEIFDKILKMLDEYSEYFHEAGHVYNEIAELKKKYIGDNEKYKQKQNNEREKK